MRTWLLVRLLKELQAPPVRLVVSRDLCERLPLCLLLRDCFTAIGFLQCYLAMIGARIAPKHYAAALLSDPDFSFVVGVSHAERCSGASKVLTVFLSLQSCIVAGEAADGGTVSVL